MQKDATIEAYFQKIISEVVRRELEIFNEMTVKEVNSIDSDEMLTVKEVLLTLKISKPTLFKRMKDKSIPYTRLGRRVLFSKKDVFQALQSKKHK